MELLATTGSSQWFTWGALGLTGLIAMVLYNKEAQQVHSGIWELLALDFLASLGCFLFIGFLALGVGSAWYGVF